MSALIIEFYAEKWDAYLQLVNSLFVKENDGIMVTDPPPNYDCDPPYVSAFVFIHSYGNNRNIEL